jgi:hypothetical protein
LFTAGLKLSDNCCRVHRPFAMWVMFRESSGPKKAISAMRCLTVFIIAVDMIYIPTLGTESHNLDCAVAQSRKYRIAQGIQKRKLI